MAAMAEARARGWSIAVDAASAAPLVEAGGDTFLDWIGTGVLLFANDEEAGVLVGHACEAAATTLGARCGQTVVKRGASGALWSDGSTVLSVPAADVTVVDSTGAGDAFAAGFLAGDGPIEQRLLAATRVAAKVVARVGARPGPLSERGR